MTDVETQTQLEDQLDEWLAGAEAEVFSPPANLEQADRLGGALAYVDQRIAEIDQAAADRIELIRRQRAEAVEVLERRRAELERLLEDWARAVHHDDPRRVTFKLPFCGLTPKLRPRQMRAELENVPMPGLVVAVRQVLPEAIKVEEKVLAGVVKEHAVPGGPVAWPNVEEGYEAHQALVDAPDGMVEVPGVVLLVPIDGDRKFSIQRPKVVE